jgi:hypothetical protein
MNTFNTAQKIKFNTLACAILICGTATAQNLELPTAADQMTDMQDIQKSGLLVDPITGDISSWSDRDNESLHEVAERLNLSVSLDSLQPPDPFSNPNNLPNWSGSKSLGSAVGDTLLCVGISTGFVVGCGFGMYAAYQTGGLAAVEVSEKCLAVMLAGGEVCKNAVAEWIDLGAKRKDMTRKLEVNAAEAGASGGDYFTFRTCDNVHLIDSINWTESSGAGDGDVKRIRVSCTHSPDFSGWIGSGCPVGNGTASDTDSLRCSGDDMPWSTSAIAAAAIGTGCTARTVSW